MRPRDRGLGSKWSHRQDRPRVRHSENRPHGDEAHDSQLKADASTRGNGDDRRHLKRDLAPDVSSRHAHSYHTNTPAIDGAPDTPAVYATASHSNPNDGDDVPYISDSSRSTMYRVMVVDSFSSFLQSPTFPGTSGLPIVDLPIRPTMRAGLSYLHGHALPIEV